MELKINDIQLPEVIQFNYEELKQELTEKVKKYETLVYTDDQIKDAKADKANLNKLKKALNDERLRREREYMAPFNEFKTKINEIISIIDKPVALIDKQVKEFDEKRKNDKRVEIGSYWETTEHPDWLTLARLFDERWLNAGYSMKQIQTDINAWLNRISEELKTLEGLTEFSFEAVEEYKRTLDINKAIAEGKRLADIQKRKEEQERLKAEEESKTKAVATGKELAEGYAEGIADKAEKKVDAAEFMTPPTNDIPDLPAVWVKFQAKLTVEQATALREFFLKNHIEFKPL